MAQTTHFNWSTPDDTALVKNGAAAIRTLGSSADNTVQDQVIAALMGAYIHVIRERQNTVIHRDLLLNIAATWIIREDENPAEINPDIHQQKLQTFEALSKGGAHDFFYRLGIEPLMPLFNISAEEFQTLWEYNTQEIRKLNEVLRQLSSHRKAGLREQATSSGSK
jgi:hypothetical protein